MNRLDSLPTLKATIDAYGLQANKRLGQHFLLDAHIIRRIASHAGDLRHATVIEIGPGPGGLTRALLGADAKHVIVIEKDPRCLPILHALQERSEERLTIISGDALTADLTSYPAPRKIVANLPYNVGTELLLHWLDDIARDSASYVSLTLMFQKEVAERITASPGNKSFGRLSVLAQWLCDISYDMELPPGAFSPPPQVSSAVITLRPRTVPQFPVQKTSLEQVLLHAFGQRRKMLRAALKGLIPNAEAFLTSCDIDPTLRAEQLDLPAFGRMTQAWEKHIGIAVISSETHRAK